MLLGVFFFSVMGVLAKLAGERLPTAEIVFARAVVTLAMSAFALRSVGSAAFGTARGLLVARGLYGFVALSCLFYSVTHLPLADATALQFTNPILTALLAVPMLGERLGRSAIAGSVLSLVGVVLVARPSFVFGAADALDPVAVAIAVVGAAFSALAYVTVRRLGTSEDPRVVVFYFALVALPGSLALLALGTPVVPRGIEWALLVGVGVFAQLGQVQLTNGLRLEAAGRASSANYTQILFAYAFGVFVFDEEPSLLGVAGALLIVAGTWLVARPSTAPA